jgi:hypothetical protein
MTCYYASRVTAFHPGDLHVAKRRAAGPVDMSTVTGIDVGRRELSIRPPRCGTCGRCSRCLRWTEPEDAFVDALLGHFEPADIAARLTHQFGVERTATAVIQRLKRRGRSRWMGGPSLRDLERIFGMDHRAIVCWWIQPGLLVGRRWSGRGPP